MMKDLYLAAGCFWGAEHYLKRIRGVVKTEAGYANGNISHPTYREVYTDTTGYAEAVHVTYDPDVLGLERLVQIYFMAIDPTSVNKQGEDHRPHFREQAGRGRRHPLPYRHLLLRPRRPAFDHEDL